MKPWTWNPTTEQVRLAFKSDDYLLAEESHEQYSIWQESMGRAFDRWLKNVRSEAWDEAVETAYERLRGRVISSDGDLDGMIDQHTLLYKPVNPYKEQS